ncbi:spore germination protein GerPE [Paenibacillus sp. SN-8-1]|uniref:spore germination protein GerPE n=1 Tax=Paenibacillus sp. SN-8-1 TaxID=3435409 RepID=UPI003D9A82F4
MTRSLKVDQIYILDVSDSSSFIYGDTGNAFSRSRTIAIERSIPIFRHAEGRFTDFSVFTRSVPIQTVQSPSISAFLAHNELSTIHIDSIHINEVTSSSSIQIGELHRGSMTSRMKYVKQESDIVLGSSLAKSLKVY